MSDLRELVSRAQEWHAAGEEVALATLVGMRGSAPRRPGARLIVTRSGKMHGSVSGGCVENDVFERAMLVLDSGAPDLATYGIADELGWEVGLSCGGSIDVFIQPFVSNEAVEAAASAEGPALFALAIAPHEIAGGALLLSDTPVGASGSSPAGGISPELDARIAADAPEVLATETSTVREYDDARVFIEALVPAPHLVIGGGTHAGIHLAQMASRLGFRVTVLDARGLFATPERFPDAEVIRAQPEKALPQIAFDASTCVAVLSHDPKFDLPVLAHALRSPARYIGAMGSRKTAEDRRASLRDMGFSDEEIARIHSPIGLDIGAATPEEIALSVLAEVTAARRGR